MKGSLFDFDVIYELKYKDALQKNLELENQLKQLTEFSHRHQNIIDDTQNSNDQLKRMTEQKNNDQNDFIQQSEDYLQNAEINLANKQETIQKQAQQIEINEKKMKEDKNIIKKVKDEKDKLQSEVRAHMSEVATLRAQIAEYIKKWKYCLLNHHENEIAAQKALLKQLTDQFQKLQDENEQLMREKDQLLNNDPRLRELNNQLRDKDAQLADLSKANQQLKNQLNAIRENIRLKEIFQNDIQKDLKEKNDRITSINERIAGLKEKIKELELAREEKNKKLSNQLQELDEVLRKLNDLTESNRKNRGDEEEDYETRMMTLKKRVKFAVKTIISLRAQFAEIRRYDQKPREDPLRILMCGLYLTDHINEEEFHLEITEPAQWNYIKNFYGYSLVVDFSRFDIEEHMTEYDVPIIENIRAQVAHIDNDDINQYSRCIGALQMWIQTMLVLYDAKIEQLQKEGKLRPDQVRALQSQNLSRRRRRSEILT